MKLVAPGIIGLFIISLRSVSFANDPCPPEMKLVEGEYCPSVSSTCLKWKDPPDSVYRRCIEYGASTCLLPKQHKRFCMQTTEFLEQDFAKLQASDHAVKSVKQVVDPTSQLPLANIDYWQARDICRAKGWRLCSESEFEFSCSGQEMRPYPTGWKRDCSPGSCNCDREVNVGVFPNRVDHRETPSESAKCVSQAGVLNLVGNCDEIYERDRSPGKYRVVLKGGHWLAPARNRCFDASTVVHSEEYSHLTLSIRCCDDPSDDSQ